VLAPVWPAWGKLVRTAIQMVTALGGALGVLEKLDLLGPIVSAVHKLLRVQYS
jgi:hypothetical protein